MSQDKFKKESNWEKEGWASWIAGWAISVWGCLIIIIGLVIGIVVFSLLFPPKNQSIPSPPVQATIVQPTSTSVIILPSEGTPESTTGGPERPSVGQPTSPPVTQVPITLKPGEPPATRPLEFFGVYIAGCRSVSTVEKPGNRLVTLAIEAGGGNGIYRYYYQVGGQWIQLPDKFITIEWEAGTGWSSLLAVESASERLEFPKHFNPDDLPPQIECLP